MVGWIESLWPSASVDALSDDEIADIYAYPNLSGKDCWLRANFIASLDGAATLDGRSGPLSGSADQRVFRLLRALADVILVGAGTVRVEGYGSTHIDVAEHSFLRHRAQHLVPPIAVVTRSGDLDPTGDLFIDNIVSPIVLTTRATSPERLEALEAAGADIVFTGEHDVSLPHVLDELACRGLQRVLCEGGPQLFASLLLEDRVDELCLTLAPTLVGGSAPRISRGATPPTPPVSMGLASVLFSYDSLLLRYRRR